MTPTLTVEQILAGTTLGRLQAVGPMAVVPILGDPSEPDPGFAPPDLEVSVAGYGQLRIRNRADRPTIVPPGAAWVTRQKAQDHTTGGGALIPAAATASVDTASCIEETQGGYIRGATRMLILPAALRAPALAQRKQSGYDKLWPALREFSARFGITERAAHLETFLTQHARELDEFVAEFERVPGQVGALVLIGDRVVGLERAPSEDFFAELWVPLIRVCYGSLALQQARSGALLPSSRRPLARMVASLGELREALEDAERASALRVEALARDIGAERLAAADPDARLAEARLVTLASPLYAGQAVAQRGRLVYASLCAAAA